VTRLLTDCECNIHKHCVDHVHELCSKKKIKQRQSMLDRIMIRKPPINNPSKSSCLTCHPSVVKVKFMDSRCVILAVIHKLANTAASCNYLPDT